LFFQVKGRKYLKGVEEEGADKDVGLTNGEITGSCINLLSEELHELFALQNIYCYQIKEDKVGGTCG
jgi:hypothetical protein